LPIAVTAWEAFLGTIRRLARAPIAKQQGTAIQFAIFIRLLGNALTARLSTATKMKKFDQFLRLIGILPEECRVCSRLA
jgi:hypothetical protein